MIHYRRPVVAYFRVSTDKQDLESQMVTVEAWAKSRGVVVDERIQEPEPVSGREDARPEFQRLWERVKRGEVGTVVVAELSRLSRRMRTLVNFLYDCFENDVQVVSVREGWLEEAFANEIVRPIIVAVFATLYELERKMISERTKAGLERARRMGKKIGGQYKLSERQVRELVRAYREGVPVARLARHYGVSRSTIYRYLKREGVYRPKWCRAKNFNRAEDACGG